MQSSSLLVFPIPSTNHQLPPLIPAISFDNNLNPQQTHHNIQTLPTKTPSTTIIELEPPSFILEKQPSDPGLFPNQHSSVCRSSFYFELSPPKNPISISHLFNSSNVETRCVETSPQGEAGIPSGLDRLLDKASTTSIRSRVGAIRNSPKYTNSPSKKPPRASHSITKRKHRCREISKLANSILIPRHASRRTN